MKKKLLSVFVCVALILGIAAQFLSGTFLQAQAVTTHSVSNYTELSDAISSAKDGDIINITADIVVTAQLTVTKSVTINGNRHTVSVPVSGLNDSGLLNSSPSAFRVFYISSGTVVINDMTIKGGRATDFPGSGIYNKSGAALKLNSVIISNCGGTTARGSDTFGQGGGIANYGTVYLNNCSISRNGATFGGGFYNAATMYIENSTFSENRSLSIGGGGGAGESGGTLYVNNSTFANNKSTEIGGAINNTSGSAYIINSTFTGNVNFYSSGGAIKGGSSLHLANCLFAYNYSSADTGTTYSLNDFYSTPTDANYCITHGTTLASGIGNVKYSGAYNGSDNTIFAGGALTTVLNADGSSGSATVYQPFLAKTSGTANPTVLRTAGTGEKPNPAVGAGTKTGFTNGSGAPTIGYYNRSSSTWVTLKGTLPQNYLVTTDQNGVTRTDPPVIGAVETSASDLYMLKVNSAANGTVDGGTIYGDAYPSGTNVTLSAIPSNGYQFTRWDYVLGGSGTASINNPYTVSVIKNITLVPVFDVFDGFTITYVGNDNTGGTVPTMGTYSSGSNAAIANKGDLVKTGYTFTGWNTRANGSGTPYFSGDTYTSSTGQNLVLYAQWVPTPITFNGGSLTSGTYGSAYSQTIAATGGSGNFTYTLDSGTLPNGLILSPTGTLNGTPTTFGSYNFSVRATDTTSSQTAATNFTLTINSLGAPAAPTASIAAGPVDKGDTVILTAAPGATIYYTTNETVPTTGSTQYTGAITINSDTTIKAITVQAGYGISTASSFAYTIKKHSVTYNIGTATSGTAPTDSTTYEKGDLITVKALGSVTKKDHTFAGWTIASDGSGTVYAADDKITTGISDITLHAKWLRNAEIPSFIANLSGEKTYTKGVAAAAVNVSASVSDAGTVTYQWYLSNTITATGTAIYGATDASYIPKTDNTGVFYYYVVATNTDASATGTKTATATSGFYKVIVNNVIVLPPVAPSDTPNTTVQDDPAKVKDAVLTGADKDKLAEGSDISIYLKVEKTEASQAEEGLMLAVLDGKTLGQYLDISLIKNIDGSETKVEQTNGPIRITFTIPESLRAAGRTFEIIRVHDGVAVTLVDLDNDPNTITIETDRFSTYAIAYADKASTASKGPNTGDQTPVLPLALLGLSALFITYSIRKTIRSKNILNK